MLKAGLEFEKVNDSEVTLIIGFPSNYVRTQLIKHPENH